MCPFQSFALCCMQRGHQSLLCFELDDVTTELNMVHVIVAAFPSTVALRVRLQLLLVRWSS